MKAHEPISPITHVAIIYKGKTYSLPNPKRHHDVIRMIHEQTGSMNINGVQGFLDANGKFLTRTSAKWRAHETGQLLPRASSLDILFSEDIW
jgi:hypothetical protein